MEFDYRILGRQEPETAVNAMYPTINAESVPVLVATDGSDIATYPVVRAYTMERDGTSTSAITSSTELNGTLTLTADRIIFVAPHINRTKWVDSSGSDMVVFGVGTTIATDLVWNGIAKLTKKVRGVSDKALTGHLYYPWISSIMHSKGRLPILRLGMTVQVGNDPSRDLLLNLVFKRNVETADVGVDIIRRVMRWRLRSGERLNPKLRSHIEELAQRGSIGEPPTRGQFVGKSIEGAVAARPQSVPERLIARNARKAAEPRRLTTNELHQRIRTTGYLFTPQYEYITLEPGHVHESQLGLRIRSDRRLAPLDSEKAYELLPCDLQVIVRIGQDWLPLTGAGSKPEGCFVGQGELLLTDQRICCQMTKGSSRTGRVEPGSNEVIAASLLLESIDSLGVVRLDEESDVWSLVVRNNAGGHLIFRPSTDESRTERELCEPWDLDMLAERTAGLVASRRGAARPSVILGERQRTYRFGEGTL
jgi:hypothetical protein